MNFLNYKHYVISCLGVGDIICSLNALENIGREQQRQISLIAVASERFERISTLYRCLDCPHIELRLCTWPLENVPPEDFTCFSAFGTEVSWVKGWLHHWGLRTFLGEEHMIRPRNRPKSRSAIHVGVSFTVVYDPRRNISPENTIRLIDDLLSDGKRVTYFGYRGDTDLFVKEYYGNKIGYDGELGETFARIGECGSFIGADSGMAWIAAFQRVPTTILIGHALPELTNTFTDISWVEIRREP